MSLHEIFARSSRDRGRRLRLARRGPGLPGLRRWPAGAVRATARGLRRLAAIDRALAAEAPRLASMFAMFNELAAGEPVGAERLPPRARPRPRPGQVAFLAALAALVALCVALSTQLHNVIRPCAAVASASPSAPATASPSAPATASPASTALSTPALSPPALSTPAVSTPAPASASRAPGRAGLPSTGPAEFAPLRGLSCQAYAATNK